MDIMMAFSKCFLIICMINIHKCSSLNFIEENITLTIDQGTLFGRKSNDYWNKSSFYTFQGIPYAKPPIGALRFKAPQPADPWIGIYDATQVRPICPQISAPEIFEFDKNKNLEKSENCLFLNVHTKMLPKLRPVMVWIHGGGMEFGSIFEDTYGPELLMAEDIVLVQIAYRLTVFGSLSIEDPKYEIHGNTGFKDQVLALKWIQKNIHNFGGNPNQVTVFGESAGAASVHLLYLSPLAKGLFHRAIVQSGAADEPWMTSPNKHPELAKALECNSENLDEIVKCINSTSTEGIIDAHKLMTENEKLNEKMKVGEVTKFNIVTIEELQSNSFLNEHPDDIMKNGNFHKIPLIMGYATQEGFACIRPDNLSPNFTDSRKLIPKDIHIDLESEEAYHLGNKIKEFYYGNQTPSWETLPPLIDYLTDMFILKKMYQSAKIQSTVADKVPIYFYNFDYHTKLNAFQSPSVVTHFDDILYLFNVKNRTDSILNRNPLYGNTSEYVGVQCMIKLWTTFATSKTADPNPVNDPLFDVKWLPIQPNKFNYLRISENLELRENPAEDRMKFWEKIHEDYGSKTTTILEK